MSTEGTALAEVTANLARVRERIVAAGGDAARVRVVAVTKGFGVNAAKAAIGAGLVDLGENYADELVDKAEALSDRAVRWHFLGAIQRNKLARLAPVVALYESVDRVVEAEAIARRAPGAAVLLEVAPQGAGPGRGGVAPSEVDALARACARVGLEVRGLMCVAPRGARDATRRAFDTTGALVRRLGLEEASMGMSEDLELAVEAGATMVRVGRALFGTRAERDARGDVRTPGEMGWQNEPRLGGV